LPRGRHGLPAEFVERNQRQRLIASLVRTVAEHGYNDTTITRIIEGASVTSRTFYDHFESVEQCYLAAFDSTSDLLAERLAEAYESQNEWPLRIQAAIASLLDFFASHTELGRLCLVEPFVAGPNISRHYQDALSRLAPHLREGRALSSQAGSLPETTELGVLGSIASQIARKLPEPEGLPNLQPDLTQFALTPYLGSTEARRVAHLGLKSPRI
jgi:AcrR family transcriptional regulator